MYIKLGKFSGVLFLVLTAMLMSCEDDIDPVIETLSTSRAFAPVALEARVRNQVDIELSWSSEADVDEYIVEFFQDSLRFTGDPIATASIEGTGSTGTVVYSETLSGETTYSARVKAVVDGIGESKWATISAKTDSEQIFTSINDIQAEDTFVTLSWIAGSEVTNFLIAPGNLFVQISDVQKATGEAIIEGLTGATEYTVTIYNGASKRGSVEFSTLKEANVTPLDDLSTVIDEAQEGATLILAAGSYMLGAKEITKSIIIEGQKPYDMPIIDGQLTCGTAVSSITLRFLDFKGGGNYGQFFNATAATCNLASLSIESCNISGFSNNVIYNNSGGTYGDITISNSYIYDIPGGGGDGFDFRGGQVGSLTVNNTTISNGIRTLLRMQVQADVTFSNCTFYKVCNVASGNNRGFFRMSGGGGSLEVSNCLFVETGLDDNGTIRGNWSSAGDISPEVSTDYAANYYFNTIGLFEGEYLDPSEVSAQEADPGFEDPENADFTITNQLLIDEAIGDARWWF